VEAKLFHVDRQMDGWMDGWTDMTNLIVAFRKFVNVPKKDLKQQIIHKANALPCM
jgi:hypothetical protein